MSYTIEEIGRCTKKFLFNLGDVDLSKEINASLEEKRKKSSLQGFRKGKAPLPLIWNVYGPQVEADILYRFISLQFMESIRKEDIQAIGDPRFINPKYEKGHGVSFEATIEYIPKVKLNDLSHLSFTKTKTTVSDKDVKKVLNGRLEERAEMVEVKNAVLAKGHTAVINFEGETENGQRPKDMKGKEFLLEVGSGSFIAGFEDAIVGMKVEERREISLTFPSDYHVEDLQNMKVKFEVDLLEIKEKKRPELTDELAKEFDYKSKEDMEIKIRKILEYQKEKEVTEKLHKEILDKLIEENKFDIPQTLVEEQKKAILENISEKLTQQGQSEFQIKEYFNKWGSDVSEKAIFQVQAGIILKTLGESYSIEVSEQDLNERYDKMAEESGLTKEQITTYYKENKSIIKNLKHTIQEEKIFKEIYEKVKIVG